ncbi:MAG: tRNA (N6-isopentenyl adenosine(37)-C2)-methylthiotransferase MiaB [Thermoleophilia bacterium]
MPKYHLTTFGCQMNDHDSERIRGVLEACGWEPADVAEDAELLVYNTCAVRRSAESRLLGRLGEARRLKKERPARQIAIGGCFAQSRRDQIFAELPFVDVAFGPQNIGQLPGLLEAAATGPAPACAFDEQPFPSAGLPARRPDRHRAWVQVMTGCTNFCSYCVVPQVRGPERSRAAVDIAAEVERLVADGVVEITLLGQNVNAYGLDLAEAGRKTGTPEDFAGLLARLDGIAGLERIRFTTSHPKDLDDALIEAIRDIPSVCEHLHLPAQSGSTRILTRMNRGYTREQYLERVRRLYEAIPALALTTDLIVGFPAEREEDFYRTMTLVEGCRFDGAFTFVYSPRPGTGAAEMPGRVPEVTISRRMRELIQLTQTLAEEKNRALVGSPVEVLVEGASRQGGGQLRGRTRTNKIVNFSGTARTGDLVRVSIDAASSTTLGGRQAGG